MDLIETRQKIVGQILTNGLLPAASLQEQGLRYVSSGDKELCKDISGRFIKIPAYPTVYPELKWQFRKTLYGMSDSVFPVIAERQRDDTIFKYSDHSLKHPLDKRGEDLLGKRMQASFLIICNASDINPFGLDDAIEAGKFTDLIFPQKIYDELQNFVVGFSNLPTIHTAGLLKRIVFRSSKTVFDIPNYESVIRGMVGQKKGIWIHGVRLPIQEDLCQNSDPGSE